MCSTTCSGSRPIRPGASTSSRRSPPNITGFLLIDFALAGDWEGWRAARRSWSCRRSRMALFVIAPLARITRASMLAVARQRFRPHRALGRPVVAAHHRHLRAAQRHPAGADHRRHRVLDHAGRQRAGREGVLLAGRRLLRARRAALVGLRARAGLRAADGVDLRHRELRSTSSTASPIPGSIRSDEPSATLRPCRLGPARQPADGARRRPARSLLCLVAIFGPWLVPYDPIASNVAQRPAAAERGALGRHRPARPRRASAASSSRRGSISPSRSRPSASPSRSAP